VLRLRHLSGPTLHHKRVLKKGDLPDKAFGTSQIEAKATAFSASTLDTLSSASLSARAFSTSTLNVPHCNSLLSKSLFSKFRHNVNGCVPCPGHLCQQCRHICAALGQELQRQNTGGDERAWRTPEACGQDFPIIFRLTQIGCRMFWSIETSVSCNNSPRG
jgi:hypothetical protein